MAFSMGSALHHPALAVIRIQHGGDIGGFSGRIGMNGPKAHILPILGNRLAIILHREYQFRRGNGPWQGEMGQYSSPRRAGDAHGPLRQGQGMFTGKFTLHDVAAAGRCQVGIGFLRGAFPLHLKDFLHQFRVQNGR